MLVFIDDSGDAGFKLYKGSSKFFVISLVIFNDELEAEKVAVKIKELKRLLKFPDDTEFKFSKSRDEVKEKFLKTIEPFKFKVRCLVINKEIIRSEELKNNNNSFYSYAIKMVLKYSDKTIFDAKIRIDGGGDRTFRKSFLCYLRQQLNSGEKKIMENCRLVNSKGSILIQMADMVAGSIKRSYDGTKKDSKKYKDIIKKHIEDEWQFK